MTPLFKAAYLTYGITTVINRSAKREVAECRYVIMFFLHEYYGYNQVSCGRELGGYNHTNVAYACKVVRNLYRIYPEFRGKIHGICDMIGISHNEIRTILRGYKNRTCSKKELNLSTTVESK